MTASLRNPGGAPPVAERDLDLGPYTIRTRSNRTLDYEYPRADSISIDDVVAGLACEPRYAGQVPRHYSVAEHLCLATRIGQVIRPDATNEALFAVLMHDAAEAYVKDLPGPLKRLIGEPYRRIERAVEAAIFERFGVVFEPHRAFVKECDRLAYLVERSVLCGWEDVALPDELGQRVAAAKRAAAEVWSNPRTRARWFDPGRAETEYGTLEHALPWPEAPYDAGLVYGGALAWKDMFVVLGGKSS